MTFVPALTRRSFGALALGSLAACAATTAPEEPSMNFLPGYGPIFDAGYTLPGVPPEYTQGVNRRMTGIYAGEQGPGTLDVDPYAKFLYLINDDGTAIRYPIGVGRAGLSFSGNGTVQVMRKWPGWTPTPNMLRREPEVYGPYAGGIPGGLRSPLGSRALYLYKNGRDTFYRIHGTNDMTSIGNSGSAGCIRMFNQDIIDLFERSYIGLRVHVRTEEESLRVDPENFGRGIEMPPVILDPEDVYGEAAVAADRPPDFDAVNPYAPVAETDTSWHLAPIQTPVVVPPPQS